MREIPDNCGKSAHFAENSRFFFGAISRKFQENPNVTVPKLDRKEGRLGGFVQKGTPSHSGPFSGIEHARDRYAGLVL